MLHGYIITYSFELVNREHWGNVLRENLLAVMKVCVWPVPRRAPWGAHSTRTTINDLFGQYCKPLKLCEKWKHRTRTMYRIRTLQSSPCIRLTLGLLIICFDSLGLLRISWLTTDRYIHTNVLWATAVINENGWYAYLLYRYTYIHVCILCI